jgi:hypothetical protein
MSATALDAAGRRRSPATMPGYFCGRTPQNKGMRYRLTRRALRRSLRSCGQPETVRTDYVRGH